MVLPTLRNPGSHSCRFCLLSLLLYSVVIVHLGHSFLIPLSPNHIGLLHRQQQQQQRGQGRSTRQQSMKSSSRRYSMAGGSWSSNTTSSTSTSSYEITSSSAETLEPPDRQRRSSATTTTTTTTTATTAPFIQGPPRDTKPDYENIHGPMGKMVDQILLRIFRSRMAEHIGVDSKLPQVSSTTTMTTNHIERQVLGG
jgi:hypothetical protein